jgi:aryl-alcohol dehydrogenase-like predicted oxidoreductase
VRTRTLGAAGPPVGAVGLGCMGMSWAYSASERDDEVSVGVIRQALDLGVTLIDTADVYGPFTNEELVGRALSGRRDEVVLATKAGLVVEDAAEYRIRRDGRPEHLLAACDASLRRLGVDVIDLYQLHRPDPAVTLEDSIGALAQLVEAGKVRHLGVSELTVGELERAHAVHPLTSVQSELSLWTRDALADVLPWCRGHGVAFLPFSPLGRGFLTGRYRDATAFDADDFRARNPRFATGALTANLAVADRVRDLATGLGVTAGQLSLAWLLAQGEHVVPIPGTKRPSYLVENAAAADLDLAPETLAALDDLPAAVGERY